MPSVTDAILGALTLPDIGQFFPDTDPRWKVIDVPKPKTLNAPLLSFVRRYEDS
jgi:2C-methyl-D-erythritol 2,4-cyclodiphosphate synthase